MAMPKKDFFDLDQALQHLKLLGYSEGDPVYLRFFYSSSDPRKTGDRGRKLTVPSVSELHRYKREIEKLQAEGRGVYFVVNGGGHTDKDVTKANAIFAEDDQRPKNEQNTRWRDLKLPEPTCQVDTGGKSIHNYWGLAKSEVIATWRPLQADLLDYVDGDRAIKNPSRVMRLAGAWHVSYKGDPNQPFDSGQLVYNQTQIISASGQRYPFSQLREAIRSCRDGVPVPMPRIFNGSESRKGSEPAPLYCFLTKDDRSLIESGSSEGTRNNDAHKLARNLIGTSLRLDYLGIPWCDDPNQLYLDFCRRCPSNDWNEREWEQAWRNAFKSNPTATLTDDALWNCYSSWLKNQLVGSNNNGLNSKRGSREQTGAAAGKKRNLSDKVMTHPKFTPLSDSELSAKVDELINLDLPPSKLTASLNQTAQLAHIPVQEVRKLYLERTEEISLAENRENTLAELEQLREATKSRISLNSIVPPRLAEPIEKLANWLNLRPECYLTAVLAGISTRHDTETSLVLHRDWDFTVTPNLFAAIVSPSSQKKSPIIKAMVTKPLRALQRKALKEYKLARQQYETDLARYEQLKRNKDKKALSEEFPDGRPVEPRQKLYYFTNATGEGIINQVAAHPDQGLLYLKDELAGVFKSANQYRGGRGSDEEDLLSYYDGTGGTVLRANGTQADLDGLLLGILGSIQPGVLQKLLGDFEDSNGNWARFIFVWQPLAASKMNADGGKFDISSLIAWLYEEIDKTSAQAPTKYALTPDAFELFCAAYNQLEQLRISPSTSPAMQNVWGKSEGRIGKLAIDLHRIEAVLAGQLPSPLINRNTVKAAIALTYFYAQQVQALYAMLGDELALSPMLAKVIELAERKGDWIKTKDVQFAFSAKKRPKPETIRQWFKELVELGQGVTDGQGRSQKFRFLPKLDKLDKKLDKKSNSQTKAEQGVQEKLDKLERLDALGKNSDSPQTVESQKTQDSSQKSNLSNFGSNRYGEGDCQLDNQSNMSPIYPIFSLQPTETEPSYPEKASTTASTEQPTAQLEVGARAALKKKPALSGKVTSISEGIYTVTFDNGTMAWFYRDQLLKLK